MGGPPVPPPSHSPACISEWGTQSPLALPCAWAESHSLFAALRCAIKSSLLAASLVNRVGDPVPPRAPLCLGRVALIARCAALRYQVVAPCCLPSKSRGELDFPLELPLVGSPSAVPVYGFRV